MLITSILFWIVKICCSLLKRYYLKYKRLFFNFLFRLLNFREILNILKEKMIVIATVFPILETVKGLARPLSKKRRFRASFDDQPVKAYQSLVKPA